MRACLRRLIRLVGTVPILAAGLVPAAAAQGVVGFVSGRGEAGVDAKGTWHRIADGRQSLGADYVQWFQVPMHGVLFDRNVVSYSLTLRPSFRQHVATGLPEALDGRQLGLAFRSSVLAALPVSLSLGATRTAGSSAGGFGTSTEFLHSTVAADLVYRNTWFPSRLSFVRQTTSDAFLNSFGAVPVQRDLVHRTIRLSGHSSKVNFFAERVLYDDRTGANDLAAWNGRLTHVRRWGRWNQGSRIESTFERSDQTGAFASARRRWTEHVRLQHHPMFATNYTWRQVSTRIGDAASTTRALETGVDAKLQRALSAGIQAATYSASFEGGTERVYALRPRLGINLGIVSRARFVASGSMGVEHRSRGGATDLSSAVLDEAHDVGSSRSFTLDQPDVDLASVVVRRGDQGFVYEVGIDYRLLPVGHFLRIDIPPDSRIQAGETVLVSYRFALPGGFVDDALTAEYQTSFSFPGIRLHHQRSVRGAARGNDLETRLGVVDYSHTQTGLSVRRPVPRGEASLDAAVRTRRTGQQRTVEYAAGAGLSLVATPSIRASSGIDWSASRSDATRLRSIAGNVALSWVPSPALRLSTQLDAFTWWQDALGAERFLGVTLDIGWRVRQIETQVRYEHHRRSFAAARTTNRLTFHAVRRF